MDLEAFEAVHAGEWAELDVLVRRRRLTGAETDRLVTLYQRTATHLSQVRSAAPDPVLVGRLSTLVARARGRLTGSGESAWRDVGRFVTVSCPAALYRIRWWVTAVTVASLLVMVLAGWYVVSSPEVQASLLSEAETRQLVEVEFANYYSESPHASFAAKVWTNNAWIAVQCVLFGVSGVWPVYVLVQNSIGVGFTGGIMVANGRADVFFGLITPHGLLELFAVFTAAAAGLKLFWSWVAPGSPATAAGARPGRARAVHRGRRPRRRARGVGRRRGLRDAERAAHLGPDRHRRARPRCVAGVLDRAGPQGGPRRRDRRPARVPHR